jgi:hypothetical protein
LADACSRHYRDMWGSAAVILSDAEMPGVGWVGITQLAHLIFARIKRLIDGRYALACYGALRYSRTEPRADSDAPDTGRLEAPT